MSEHFTTKIERGEPMDHDFRTVGAERREGGTWYVNTETVDGEGWRPYARAAAKERDVKQLLRKEYDNRY